MVQVTRSGTASAAVIREHRAAWGTVRDTLGYDDAKGSAVYVLNIVYLMAQCTMVSFETLSSYSAGKRWAFATHGVFTVIYLLEICILGDSAHRAVTLVRVPPCRTPRAQHNALLES